MFLHKLEIQGFKSFVDRTEVFFSDGVTGVIGPNGCGKTNVSDAIRWVLGEQSAKLLRGDTMEDVIFNGAPSRKPLGMAEVHLTFKNDRGLLPTEFAEVTVSRRVFRSGLSEYFLNKTPCRLKDIRDLFFDTGMGSHAYSVIERQMVDQVLSDNSGHRRFLFEEASGITKYKARKRETLQKLDATESDLTRLNDIVFEIERELRSLARQVGKARRFARLRDEIQALDLTLTAGRVAELRTREKELAEQWQEEAVRREGVTVEVDLLEVRLNDQRLTLLELERELSTAQAGLRDREDARGQAEHQIVLLRERVAGLLRRAEEAAEEAARMRERLAEVQTREREAEAKLAECRASLGGAQSDADASEQALQAVDGELRERRHVAQDHRQLSLDLFSAEAEKRAACDRVRERMAALAERRESAERRVAELGARLEELDRVATSGEARRVALAADLDESKRMLLELEAAIAAASHSVGSADESLSQLRQDAAAAESRLETLLELKRGLDGVSEGARVLLSSDDRIAGLVGLVADVLEVPSRFLEALEASLGEASAFVLAEDRDALDASLERLRVLESGRATLVDLSALTTGTLTALPDGPGVVGRASELVRCDARFRPLVDRLLGAVVVVEDRAAAARLAVQSEGGLRFVSLDGEVWERGRVRAGSRLSTGLLHREMEIRELSGRLADLRLAVEAQGRERASHDAARNAAIAARATAVSDVDARREALERAARDLDATARDRQWTEQETRERRDEIAAFAIEIEGLDRAQVRAEADLGEFQQQLEKARLEVADLDGVVVELEGRRDEASARAQAARERLLALAREQGEWEAQWGRAEQTRRELESGLGGRAEEEAQSRARIVEIEAQVTGIEAGLAGLLESESTQRARVTELQGRFVALKEELQSGDDAARHKRFAQTELAELLHQIELDRLQSRAELERTFERLRTEYRMDPEQWNPEPAAEGFDAAQAQTQLEELRGRFGALGPVNLLALEDYTTRKDRHEFLTVQRADLVSAREQLLEAIQKINTTASDLFRDTFEKVQGHFRDIFKTLFEGGDAELRALGEDPLECEIEIVAKPRGKHLQSVTLMSGGERALTAIALLFAIYLVKPSPFCLLDEVDAPLDDANVDRFLRMLRRFANRTQFVIITHNKKTMEAADVLYGVTMQELGLSKLVSVRFDGVESADPSLAPRELVESAAG
ncbi:MAG: chromosome segregation protein SMC [Candidatus Eisenbacteria bacterium]|uniref:Chromosome partition protein Smc n=1 Tax=Eiseniibacteriota bacterium TaxID=2212470 RepID=A0A849SHR5_UNCEI|nr:chromosome segregation protein SMC [Candidatus Eisenbacteria bacterium]